MKIEKPIVLFGNPNSGTTLLQQLLLTHPDLSGPKGESQFLSRMPQKLTPWLGKPTFMLYAAPQFKLCYYCTETDYDETTAEAARTVLDGYVAPGTRLITKNPSDCCRARLLQSIFPDAYFIAIVRNGYAVSEGIIRNRKFHPCYPENAGLFTTTEDAAEQWFRANILICSLQEHLERYLIVKYEDLTENPQLLLERITDFCALRRHRFVTDDVESGKNKKQIDSLSASQIETITKIALPMLLHFRYEVLCRELRWANLP